MPFCQRPQLGTFKKVLTILGLGAMVPDVRLTVASGLTGPKIRLDFSGCRARAVDPVKEFGPSQPLATLTGFFFYPSFARVASGLDSSLD